MQGATRFTTWRVGEKRFFFARLLLFMALFAAISPLHAKRDAYGMEKEYFDFDESQVEQWKESEISLPPYPRDENLLAVPLLATDTLKIYIDRASLSRGPDRVARFSLVVESPSGARSVFYDGLRCETREYKTYAIGGPEQTFTPVKNAVVAANSKARDQRFSLSALSTLHLRRPCLGPDPRGSRASVDPVMPMNFIHFRIT